MWDTSQVCSGLQLPHGNIFVWVCMSFGTHRCLHLMERMQNQGPQDLIVPLTVGRPWSLDPIWVSIPHPGHF